MDKGRMEAFSDGVIAIIITIMVLELKVPHGEDFQSLRPMLSTFLSYALSFLYVGVFWNNHHHMLNATERVTGGILWANLHLLFWVSLFPFAAAWMGETKFAAEPMAIYGVVLFMSAVAYWILQQVIIASQGPDSLLEKAVGSDWKGKLSPILTVIAIAATFYSRWVAQAIFVSVVLMWLVPDRRIERALNEKKS
jgi:uncharacterized membrane protein